VAPLDPAPATPAPSHAHPEPGDDGLQGGELGLELLGPTLEVEPLAAVRAAIRQRGLCEAVGLGGRRTMAVAAMGLALLAARRLPLLLRLVLGERRRLALGGPADLLQQPLQLGDAGLDLTEALPQPLVLGRQLVVRRRPLIGLGRSQIGRRLRRADPPSYTTRCSSWWTPLNKYFAFG